MRLEQEIAHSVELPIIVSARDYRDEDVNSDCVRRSGFSRKYD
jgi:hypothetical protein